jgi:hypothetical protein
VRWRGRGVALTSVGRKFVKKLRMSRELSVQSTVTISGKYDSQIFALDILTVSGEGLSVDQSSVSMLHGLPAPYLVDYPSVR